MRFSLRRITSGALISSNLFKRLLRMITRRYRSFRSDDAKRPPSNGTNGRSSGGITGIYCITIHSGRFVILEFASRKASTTLRRFNASALRCCDVSVAAALRRSNDNWSSSIRASRSCTASAPILAINLFGSSSGRYWFSFGNASRISRYSSSVSRSP